MTLNLDKTEVLLDSRISVLGIGENIALSLNAQSYNLRKFLDLT